MKKKRTLDSVISDFIINYGKSLNIILNEYNIKLLFDRKHIIHRLKDRNIDNLDLFDALTEFKRKRICEFIYLTNLEYDKRPFHIEIHFPDIILSFGRRDDFLWKLNTVLDPKIHSKYDQNNKFYATINKGKI